MSKDCLQLDYCWLIQHNILCKICQMRQQSKLVLTFNKCAQGYSRTTRYMACMFSLSSDSVQCTSWSWKDYFHATKSTIGSRPAAVTQTIDIKAQTRSPLLSEGPLLRNARNLVTYIVHHFIQQPFFPITGFRRSFGALLRFGHAWTVSNKKTIYVARQQGDVT